MRESVDRVHVGSPDWFFVLWGFGVLVSRANPQVQLTMAETVPTKTAEVNKRVALRTVLQNGHTVAFRDTPEPRPRRERPLKGRGEGRAAGGLIITHEVM